MSTLSDTSAGKVEITFILFDSFVLILVITEERGAVQHTPILVPF